MLTVKEFIKLVETRGYHGNIPLMIGDNSHGWNPVEEMVVEDMCYCGFRGEYGEWEPADKADSETVVRGHIQAVCIYNDFSKP